jgi:hypothetical protein
MNNEMVKLVFRMVINTMAGKRERNEALYEEYLRKGENSMEYVQESCEGIITIGEYVEFMQPWTYRMLKLMPRIQPLINKAKDITEQILQAADVSGEAKHYAKLMQERPLPGRAGLLPGEREDALL